MEAIAELAAAMMESAPLGPKELFEMLKIGPDDLKAAAMSKRSIFVSREALKKAVESMLDGLITA
jgi:hypothetical protein